MSIKQTLYKTLQISEGPSYSFNPRHVPLGEPDPYGEHYTNLRVREVRLQANWVQWASLQIVVPHHHVLYDGPGRLFGLKADAAGVVALPMDASVREPRPGRNYPLLSISGTTANAIVNTEALLVASDVLQERGLHVNPEQLRSLIACELWPTRLEALIEVEVTV